MIRRASLLVALLLGCNRAAGAFILGGERVVFDIDLMPRFTAHQAATTSAATRAGLERWAQTQEGRSIIIRFERRDRTVYIREDRGEPAPGRAPQPSLATLLAAHRADVLKKYELILNPSVAAQYDNGSTIDLGLPRSASDVMALAWAGEMLHVDFYAHGVPLPHHERPEFQERWHAVAAQLGLANVSHRQ